MFRKSRPYEGSCHIPLFITAGKNVLPDLKAGSVCHTIAELRDIMPTLLDIAGSEIPSSVDGESLLPLTGEPEKAQRTWLHGEHSYGEFSNHWIVTETDKYIWHPQTGQEQYFDLAADPHELTDLIHEPDSPRTSDRSADRTAGRIHRRYKTDRRTPLRADPAVCDTAVTDHTAHIQPYNKGPNE